MHELSVTQGILDTVLNEIKDSRIKRVCGISLVMGTSYDYVPEIIQEYFDMLSENTVARHARISVQEVPARIFCDQCQREYEGRNVSVLRCVECGSSKIHVLCGREFYIQSIEVEE